MTRLRTGLAIAALLCAAVDVRADDAAAPDGGGSTVPDAGSMPDAGPGGGADGGTPSFSRVVVLHYTPTERAQMAIWIEKPDGTFMATVGLTHSVAVRGIGNRPGATQMNSGYHWPYGRREGVLPIWAHRRAAAPGAAQFPRVIFQSRPEGLASRLCEDSMPDSYFCLSFNQGSSLKAGLDAVSCASVMLFNSDKGRILSQRDVMNGYAEPAMLGGQPVMRPLPMNSLYPPRRDVTPCTKPSDDSLNPYPSCGNRQPCNDHVDVAGYNGVTTGYAGEDTVSGATPQKGWGYAAAARRVMPDIDTVTMATPAADQDQSVMFTVPDAWPEGDYVAWVEINTEGDYNGTYSDVTLPNPADTSHGWDTYAVSWGYPYRGQPSVVFSVPFSLLGASSTSSTSEAVGYGSVDGIEPDADQMHAMDGTITDDPVSSPGSGADRLRMPPGATARLTVEVRDEDFCGSHPPPGAPTGVTAAPVADVKHSQQWAHLHFIAPASDTVIANYEVRTSTNPMVEGDTSSFLMGLPGQAATAQAQALMVPTTASPGAAVDADFGGLNPSTHYYVGVRAVDACNRAGPHAVAEVTTTRTNFTQLQGGCFVATAAWGSALAPEVAALRRARDWLRPASSLFAAAADLYYRSGPAAADLLARSDMARAMARQLIGPVGAIAASQASW